MCVAIAVSLVLAGCGTVQVAATPARDTGVTAVAASCVGLSPAAQFAGARLVFVGRMLSGPTTPFSGRHVLGSPATMRVERYLKGHGPRTVKVATAVTIEPRGSIAANEDGIDPQAGERWKIYTSSRRQPFDTSICAGSAQVKSRARPAPPGGAALRLWRAFPVDAKPRPVVPLGEGIVLDPATGFRTTDASLAYLEARFELRTTLPVVPATFGRFHAVSAADAWQRLRANGNGQHFNVPPLIVARVHPGTATFVTDRGRERLPAWLFYFRDVADPAAVLALAPPEVFIAPPLHRFGPTGPGNSIEDAATESARGTRITLSFIGAHTGTGPCDASYTATALADRRAVAFSITTQAVPVPSGTACAAVGYHRTAVLHLKRPLGARVLISATDGGAVPVMPAR